MASIIVYQMLSIDFYYWKKKKTELLIYWRLLKIKIMKIIKFMLRLMIHVVMTMIMMTILKVLIKIIMSNILTRDIKATTLVQWKRKYLLLIIRNNGMIKTIVDIQNSLIKKGICN